MPPARSLNLLTSSLRSAISPWLYQYVRLALLSSGGWPAARAADSLASCWGEPGIDCHSTFRFLVLPHSTKVSPTALSVMSFQLAENQTLNTPDVAAAAWVVGWAAAAAVVGAAGGLVGWAAGLAADWSDVDGALHAARARPSAHALRARNSRREKGRRLESIRHPLAAHD